MISLSVIDNFYPVMSYRRVQREKKTANCCVRSLVMVRKPVAIGIHDAIYMLHFKCYIGITICFQNYIVVNTIHTFRFDESRDIIILQ